MPIVEPNDQTVDQTRDVENSPSHEEDVANSGSAAEQVSELKKAAAKKTARTRTPKAADSSSDVATVASALAAEKESQPDHPSGSAQDASVADRESKNDKPADRAQADKATQASAIPVATTAQAPAPAPGGTGLMKFWLKVGGAVLVVVAAVVGIFTLFSDDEAPLEAQKAQPVTSVQGDKTAMGYPAPGDSRAARELSFPPAADQLNVTAGPPPNRPPAAGGTAVPPGRATAPGQAPTDRASTGWGEAAPRSGYFYDQEPPTYRPEMYRPLKAEEDRSPAAQSAAGQQKPAASAVQAPTPYTQPGLYGYPAGGPYYGGYPPQPGTYTYPPAPYYGGYGR